MSQAEMLRSILEVAAGTCLGAWIGATTIVAVAALLGLRRLRGPKP